jgi:2-succinyl-5-enolpyruvyl-6-hydroxy-3-cyclohexene-1-carboxylate synthase
MSINASHLARSTIRQLIELGVSDFVLSPGSRNAPLSIALHEAAKKEIIELHVRIDERGAAYYALGISKASNTYVAVICTSGTAAANYHPAALEAYHSNTSLLFITADRPARLRRTGANQTTLQDGILSPLITIDTAEIVDCKKLLRGGPVHLNLQFDEPLLEIDPEARWLDGLEVATVESQAEPRGELRPMPRSVMVIGHDMGGFDRTRIQKMVADLAIPVIAEDPLSFSTAVPHAALILADASLRESLKADQVIVIGRTTLSRSVNAYVAQSNNVVVIDSRIEKIDTSREATNVLLHLPEYIETNADISWINLWKSLGSQASNAIELDWSEQLVAREISRAMPDYSALFVGSSRPVRDIEAFAQPRSGIHVYANRGLAGIDGNISTAFGISTRFERTYSIIGDLTFLHDLSALANSLQSHHTIFIIDNNGGGIFSTLPQAGVDGFEKIFGTPHGLNLESIIAGFGYSVEKVKTLSDLSRTFHHDGLHFVVVEVPNRDTNGDALRKIHQRVASAVRIGSNLA